MARETSEGRFSRGSAAAPGNGRRPRASADDAAPDGPTDLSGRGWLGVLKRTFQEFKADNLTDWAAALTYYGVLAIFPAIIALVSIIGLIGPSATQPLLDNLKTLTPGPANDILSGAVKQIASNRGGASVAFVAGIALAIWSASGYVGAFARASNAIYEVPEGRPFWKLRPMQLIVTTLMILLIAASAIAVVVTGPVAQQLGDVVGAGSAAVTAWDIAKWPVIALIFMLMLALLYYAAPNVKHPRFRWISPGAVTAVILWVVASGAFAFYVANFGSYNKTYGTLGGVIIFLTWLWISNITVLLGAELNAETERGRQIERGMSSDKEPFLPLRDTAKLER
jgi:membrane protein